MAGARVRVRDAELAVETDGRGPLQLVLVHGFRNDRSAWRPLLERLDPARFTTTRFDLVGCGESSRPASAKRCSIEEYAADLIALCDVRGIERPVVVGHSLGGGTALRAALDAPGRFRALVLVAPVSTTGLDFLPPERFASLVRPDSEDQFALARAAFQRPPPEADFAQLLAVIERATPEHSEGAALAMRDFRVQDQLGRLDLPVLLVCGDRDRHVPLRNHLATHQAIPRCRLQVYADVGHVPWAEVPDRFAEDLLWFLERLERRS